MATNNKIEKTLEGELFKLLLDRAMGQKKLLTIAEECGVDRKSLTEFRRTGYLGKEKRQNLRDWLVANRYLKKEVEPADEYRSILLQLQHGWKWLRKSLVISVQEAALHTETPEEDIVEWENSVDPFLPFSLVQKFLPKVIEWSDQSLYSYIEEERLGKQVQLHSIFKRINKPDQSEEPIVRVNTPIMDRFLSHLKEDTNVKPNFSEVTAIVRKLNSNLPDECGPTVISDFACSNCQKWSPSVGVYCMHCGEKLEKLQQDESLFLVNKPEPKS